MNATQRLVAAILGQAIADLWSPSPELREKAKALLSNRDAVHSLCVYLTLDSPPELMQDGLGTIH